MSYAGFGEADIHLNDTWTLVAGTRWTHAETDTHIDAQPPPAWIPEFGIGIGPLGELYLPFLGSSNPGKSSASTSAHNWSWRGALRWEPSADDMFYATVARGFKGPAIGSSLGTFVFVKPELATNYEVGAKLSFFDRRLTANMAVFHTRIDNLQAEGTDNIQTPNGTILSIVLKNAGKARTQGAELELSAKPTRNLTVDFNAAYVDAKYIEFIGASCYESQTPEQGCLPIDPSDPESAGSQDLSGKGLPFAPELTANLGVRYDFVIPGLNFPQFARLDYSYQSEINWSQGLAPTTVSDPVGVLGLSFGLANRDGRFEIVGFVKNVTDEYVVNGLNGGNETITANLQPDYQRTYGITLNYRFR